MIKGMKKLMPKIKTFKSSTKARDFRLRVETKVVEIT